MCIVDSKIKPVLLFALTFSPNTAAVRDRRDLRSSGATPWAASQGRQERAERASVSQHLQAGRSESNRKTGVGVVRRRALIMHLFSSLLQFHRSPDPYVFIHDVHALAVAARNHADLGRIQ